MSIIKPALSIPALLFVALVLWPCHAQAGLNDVPKKVQQGIEQYQAGQYKQAAEAFDEAIKLEPKDARILFDLACAKAAAGQMEEALPLFQQAAVTTDEDLAARCHYNLGRLAADRARAVLEEKPKPQKQKTAPGEKQETNEDDHEMAARTKARELAALAIAHWHDCLVMNPKYADARYNLEMTRLWLNHMEEAWKQADREKRLAKMKLGEQLQWLETHQDQLRDKTQKLVGREPSPLQRLAVHQESVDQRDLYDEIEPLKQKITQTLNPPQPAQGAAPGTSPAPGGAMPGMPGTCNLPGGGCSASDPGGLADLKPEQREQAIKLLTQMADRTGESMKTAAEYLAEQSPNDAREGQTKAIEGLDQINTIITPYADLVFKAVDRQTKIVGSGKVSAKPAQPKEETAADAKGAEKKASAKPDYAEETWRQRFVERWTPVIVAKAKQGLDKMPAAESSKQDKAKEDEHGVKSGLKEIVKKADLKKIDKKGATGVPPVPLKSESAEKNKKPEKLDPAEEAKRRQENLRKSMELAVKLGPDVQRLLAEAGADLDQHDKQKALPKQKEALELLKKIAEPLKQDQKQNQKQNQQQKQNQKQNQNQSQNQKDKKDQKKDQKKQDQKKDQQKQKQDKKDQKQDQDKKNQKQKAQPRDMSKQQAEALIQKVRQRDREKEKIRKALKEAASHPPSVEKDW